MAASTSIVLFRTASGRPITASVYNAANGAIGTFLPINFTSVATSTDPTDFQFAEDVVLEDVIAAGGTPATGQVQLIKSGQPTNAIWDYSACASNNPNRMRLMWKLQAGTTYRLRVFNTLPA